MWVKIQAACLWISAGLPVPARCIELVLVQVKSYSICIHRLLSSNRMFSHHIGDTPPPAHILLVSGDEDFAYGLHRLALRCYHVHVALNLESGLVGQPALQRLTASGINLCPLFYVPFSDLLRTRTIQCSIVLAATFYVGLDSLVF